MPSHQKTNLELEARSGGPDPSFGHPASQESENAPSFPRPGQEPPLPSLPDTPVPLHPDSPSRRGSTWGSREVVPLPQPQGRKPPVRPPRRVKSSCCLIVRRRRLKKRFSGRLPHRKLLGIILLLRREKKREGVEREREKGSERRKLLSPSQLVEYSQRERGPAFQLAS